VGETIAEVQMLMFYWFIIIIDPPTAPHRVHQFNPTALNVGSLDTVVWCIDEDRCESVGGYNKWL
jgi:hypothetical protein